MRAYPRAVNKRTKSFSLCSALYALRTSISANRIMVTMNVFSRRCIGSGEAGLSVANATGSGAIRLYDGSPCSWQAPLSRFSARMLTSGSKHTGPRRRTAWIKYL